jgi:large subunit ribosomal protein L9
MPEAILLQDVDGVGEKGAVVDVSKGYLRNFLLPRKLAAPATKGALAAAQQRELAAARAREDMQKRAGEFADVLGKTVLTLERQAGDDGRLFGSVTNQDIVDAVKEARGIELDKRKVQLDEPLKTLGTHMVVVEVADGVTATVKTMVVAKQA